MQIWVAWQSNSVWRSQITIRSNFLNEAIISRMTNFVSLNLNISRGFLWLFLASEDASLVMEKEGSLNSYALALDHSRGLFSCTFWLLNAAQFDDCGLIIAIKYQVAIWYFVGCIFDHDTFDPSIFDWHVCYRFHPPSFINSVGFNSTVYRNE